MQSLLNKDTPHIAHSPQAVLNDALEKHSHKEGCLLPILHHIQDHLSYIPEDLLAPLSRAINRSRAEIHGVISFYTHFRTTPPAELLLELCRAEACQSRGANALIAHAKETLGCDFHQNSLNGRVTLAPTFCLGLCSQGPAAMLNGEPVAHITPERLDQLLKEQGVQS